MLQGSDQSHKEEETVIDTYLKSAIPQLVMIASHSNKTFKLLLISFLLLQWNLSGVSTVTFL